MKNKLKTILSKLWIAYFLSVLLAAPYYNWRFASNHGFVSWLFFGEVVATAQSLIWPYYALSSSPAKEHDENADIEHFLNAMRYSADAMVLATEKGGLNKMTPKETSDFLRLLELASGEAELVSDSYLKGVHPELFDQYKNAYRKSLRDLIEGVSSGNRDKQISAGLVYDGFCDWIGTRQDSLKISR